jgi:starch-binding outer membrane protein, SusD/RagB family
MKNLLPTLLFLGLQMLVSCSEDFLDKKPKGKETVVSFLGDPATAEQNFEKMIVAAYECFNFDEGQWGGVGHHGEWMWDIITDDAQKGGDGPGNQTWMLDWRWWNTLPTSMGPAKSAYITFNVAKERANTILEYVETYKSSLKPESYAKLKGEALFIRGYFHFYGVKLFGSFPYFSKPVDEFMNQPSASPEFIYAAIEKDLREAVALLPEKSKWVEQFGVQPEGRATKGAARAILARVLAMEIGFGFNGAQWADVYEQTSEIIKSGQYQLVPNYATIFEMEGMNNSESILEIQCVNLAQGWGKPGGNIQPIMVSPRLTCGNNKNKKLPSGWGFCIPTPSLSNAFEPGDPRRKCTIIENGDYLWEDGKPETIEQIDITVKDKCPTFMFSRKYCIQNQGSSSSFWESKNKVIIRYAEIILLQAEAAYYLKKEDEARQLINLIRSRARNSTWPKGAQYLNPWYAPNPEAGVALLPDVTTSDQALLNTIKNERRVELAHEGHRLWDLIRWGDYENAIVTYVNDDPLLKEKDPDGIKTLANFKSHLICGKVPCFPIPDEDVKQFGVIQNPGY